MPILQTYSSYKKVGRLIVYNHEDLLLPQKAERSVHAGELFRRVVLGADIISCKTTVSMQNLFRIDSEWRYMVEEDKDDIM